MDHQLMILFGYPWIINVDPWISMDYQWKYMDYSWISKFHFGRHFKHLLTFLVDRREFPGQLWDTLGSTKDHFKQDFLRFLKFVNICWRDPGSIWDQFGIIWDKFGSDLPSTGRHPHPTDRFLTEFPLDSASNFWATSGNFGQHRVSSIPFV